MQHPKLTVPYPIIVEGKYDKIRLSNIVDAPIIPTDGFGLFRRDETRILLRKLAERSPLIVLTDSDGAGKLIRSHVTSALPKDRLIQLYIPKIAGKEKRKEFFHKNTPLSVYAFIIAQIFRFSIELIKP